MKKYGMNRVFYFEGLAYGLFLSSIALSAIEIARIYQFDKNWIDSQIFIVVPIFLGAWITISGLSAQAKIAQQIQDERYLREERAAKANLPVATSTLMRLSREALIWHVKENREFPDMQSFEESFKAFIDVIRFSDEQTAERLLGIIRTYQVLSSRRDWDDFTKKTEVLSGSNMSARFNYWESACDWAVLSARIEQVFEYARGNQTSISDKKVNDRVYSQFFDDPFLFNRHPILLEIMENREKRNGFEMSFSSSINA